MEKGKIQKVKNRNVVLSVTVYPKEAAETIILLHGGPGVPDEMFEVVEVLKDKYQVINFKQRGVGDSVCLNCEYSMEEYISDIDTLSNHFNIKYFHLFGHSWGGLLAQIYAEVRPEKIKSLFLVSPGSGTNTDWEKVQKEVLAYNQKMTTGFQWMMMGINSALGMLGSNSGYRRLFKQAVLNYNKNYGEGVLSGEVLREIKAEPINKTMKQISNYPMLNKMENVNFPIIVTYGDDDIYGESKRQLFFRLPTAEFLEIKNSGHIPWKHNLERFKKELIRFYKIE